MKNHVNGGDVLDLTAPSGGVTSGVGVLIGKLFGIAVTTQAAGDPFVMRRTGQYDHVAETHATDQAWAVGDDIYWDNTNKRLTKTSSGNTKVAVATAVKASTVATGRMVLNGVV